MIYKINTKRTLLLCAIAMCCMVMIIQVLPMFVPTAHAATCESGVEGCSGKGAKHAAHKETIDAFDGKTYDAAKKEVRDNSGAFGAFAFEAAASAYGVNPHTSLKYIAVEIYQVSNLNGGWLANAFEHKSNVTFLTITASLYNAMYPTGIMLIMLFFLIEILDEVQTDHFSVEHLIKKLITLAVSILVLSQGTTILHYILELGDALAAEMSWKSTSVSGTDDLSALYDDLTSTSSGIISSIVACITALGVFLKSIPGYLMSLVCYLIAYLLSFSRFLELLIRFAFAPIGMAQLVSGGSKGAGMRYIKKFASVCIQGAVCVLALNVSPMLVELVNGLSGIVAFAVVPLTTIGFLVKAGRVADDICGV